MSSNQKYFDKLITNLEKLEKKINDIYILSYHNKMDAISKLYIDIFEDEKPIIDLVASDLDYLEKHIKNTDEEINFNDIKKRYLFAINRVKSIYRSDCGIYIENDFPEFKDLLEIFDTIKKITVDEVKADSYEIYRIDDKLKFNKIQSIICRYFTKYGLTYDLDKADFTNRMGLFEHHIYNLGYYIKNMPFNEHTDDDANNCSVNTCIIYLRVDEELIGGELKVTCPRSETKSIKPKSGMMVCMRGDVIHEVLQFEDGHGIRESIVIQLPTTNENRQKQRIDK
jgi:hypothetical protein